MTQVEAKYAAAAARDRVVARSGSTSCAARCSRPKPRSSSIGPEQSGRTPATEQPDHPAVLPAQHPARARPGAARRGRGAAQPGAQPAGLQAAPRPRRWCWIAADGPACATQETELIRRAVGDELDLRREPSADGQPARRDREHPRQDAGRGAAHRPGPRQRGRGRQGARAGADEQHGAAAGRCRAGRSGRRRAARPDGEADDQPRAVPDLSDPLPRDRRAAGPAGGRRQDPVGGRRAERALAPEDHAVHH